MAWLAEKLLYSEVFISCQCKKTEIFLNISGDEPNSVQENVWGYSYSYDSTYCLVKCIMFAASAEIEQQNYAIFERGAHKNETVLQIMCNSAGPTAAATIAPHASQIYESPTRV